MVALLSDLSLVHDYDVVSISYCGESVSNDDSGDVAQFLANPVDRTLHFPFISLVKRTGGFIKQQDLWLLNEGSCDCDPLLLTA